jgi:hypothetical protein
MMHTVTNSYFATGEGITHMVLFTKGYGPDSDRSANALNTFVKHFGDYYSQGAEVREGLSFEFNGAKLLVSDALRAKLEDWAKQAGGLEYHASLHVNLS